ncbi:MAG: hypothetical protein BWY59_00985 [Verrucomicrobia bacterium ADurb.Bin345]|nr:MAG: hypothetical protein BWY59_00985 [Verrucomicrobia bacterium ADurb.Bin345]
MTSAATPNVKCSPSGNATAGLKSTNRISTKYGAV